MADCVAIQQECIAAGRATRAKIVSQYKGDCIVTGRSWALGAAGTRRGRWARAGRHGRQQGARSAGRRAWARRQVRGRQAQVGARQQAGACEARRRQQRAGAERAGGRAAGTWGKQARGARQDTAAGAGARPGHGWERSLGARVGWGLCTRCTRPIFDPF